MKLPHSFWADNKKNPDIVYRYDDGAECVIRKENGNVISIMRDCDGHEETIILTESECSEARFDELKAFSDEDYHTAEIGDDEHRHHTISFNALTTEPVVGLNAKRKQDTAAAREKRLLAAESVIKKLGITETQRRRYLKYSSGMSTRDIADEEQVVQSSVVESIRQVEKRQKSTCFIAPISLETRKKKKIFENYHYFSKTTRSKQAFFSV